MHAYEQLYYFCQQEVKYNTNVDDRKQHTSSVGDESNNVTKSRLVPHPDTFCELSESYLHMEETVAMNLPHTCFYYKKTDMHGNPSEIETLGVEVHPERTANGTFFTSLPVEMRGITLRQLRAVYANAARRCVEEEWLDWNGQPVTPESVNLYDINKYIIKPFTKLTQKSFVETLPSTGGTQPPRFFISHFWGESFRHTLDCIETMVQDFRKNRNDEDDARGGGMTEDTPVWICAFSNNQWALHDDIKTNPKESSFTRALRVACFRTLTILDKRGEVFFRIWCDFELYLTLILAKKDATIVGVWAVYTSHKHSLDGVDRAAAGIVSGGVPGEFSFVNSRRESHFPANLILLSRNIHVLSAKASIESDRVHILNLIAGRSHGDLNATPPTFHPNFVEMENAIKGQFASSMPAFIAARAAGKAEWDETLLALSKGITTRSFKLYFPEFNPRLSTSEARELVSHIPVTCTGLGIVGANGKDGEGAIKGMIDWVEKAKTIKVLSCDQCKVGGDDVESGRQRGSQLATALELKHAESMESLSLSWTDLIDSGNVLDWASALKKMTNLKDLRLRVLHHAGLSKEEKDILRNATHASEVRF